MNETPLQLPTKAKVIKEDLVFYGCIGEVTAWAVKPNREVSLSFYDEDGKREAIAVYKFEWVEPIYE